MARGRALSAKHRRSDAHALCSLRACFASPWALARGGVAPAHAAARLGCSRVPGRAVRCVRDSARLAREGQLAQGGTRTPCTGTSRNCASRAGTSTAGSSCQRCARDVASGGKPCPRSSAVPSSASALLRARARGTEAPRHQKVAARARARARLASWRSPRIPPSKVPSLISGFWGVWAACATRDCPPLPLPLPAAQSGKINRCCWRHTKASRGVRTGTC